MSCPASEEIDAAPPPLGCSTPQQDESNGGAAHAKPDAEVTKSESEADVEKQFDALTGKKRKYSAYLKYTEVKRWSTGKDSMLEPAQINHEIYTLIIRESHEEINAVEPRNESSGPTRASD